MERTHAGAEEMCKEESASKRKCYVLITAPCVPSPLYRWQGHGVEEKAGAKE